MAKRVKTDEQHSEQVQQATEAAREVQQKIEDIEMEFDDEVEKLRSKFAERKTPLYTERGTVVQKVPNFWFTAFSNHRYLEGFVGARDEDIFKHITKFDVTECSTGYKIELTFSANDFISDQTLWKNVAMDEAGAKCTQSGVHWKTPKPAGNATDGKRDREETSFISFFEAEGLDDFEVSGAIKDELWENPVAYFLNEIDDGDDEDEEEEGEEQP